MSTYIVTDRLGASMSFEIKKNEINEKLLKAIGGKNILNNIIHHHAAAQRS